MYFVTYSCIAKYGVVSVIQLDIANYGAQLTNAIGAIQRTSGICVTESSSAFSVAQFAQFSNAICIFLLTNFIRVND